jgi:signal-transduction protein with cAMP-binding, CBS, and nucleotidyltransferase domain
MTLAEKLLALKAVKPFDLLRSEELLTIATAMTVHRFKPDAVICEAGGVINRLYVRVEGDAVGIGGTVMQHVVGTTILLTGKAAPFVIKAGNAGYVALSLPRGKFFTVINECPALLAGFFRMPLLGVDYPGSPAASA